MVNIHLEVLQLYLAYSTIILDDKQNKNFKCQTLVSKLRSKEYYKMFNYCIYAHPKKISSSKIAWNFFFP